MHDPLKQKILSYNRQVPRYTSYPPASRFVSSFPSGPYMDALSKISGDVSLYLHIPFCSRLCHYCGCHMRVINAYYPVREYLELLLKEAGIIRPLLQQMARIREIHFGGGSPTIIEAVDFAEFLKRLRHILPISPDAAISIEADPRHLSEGKIAAYTMNGVKRLSLGVQDFDHDVMATINRVQPYHLTRDSVMLARDYGIESLNFDLMYGLPKQTVASIVKTMQMAIHLKPDRISFFGYAHVPWLKKHMRLMQEDFLPDSNLRYDLYKTGEEILLRAGYIPVGIDHFVLAGDSMALALKSGDLRRNFQGYTTDRHESLIGLGASSISKVSGIYAQNETGMPEYRAAVENGVLPISRGYMLGDDDMMYGEIIESLMCNLFVDLRIMAKKYGKDADIFSGHIERLTPYIRDGFVDIQDSKIVIRNNARLMTRLICHAFDQYGDSGEFSPGKHAAAV